MPRTGKTKQDKHQNSASLMAMLPELVYGSASKWTEDAPVDQRRSQPDVVSPTQTGLPIPTNLPPFPKRLRRRSLCIYANDKGYFPCWKRQLPLPPPRSARNVCK